MTVRIDRGLIATMTISGKRQEFAGVTLRQLDRRVLRFVRLVERAKLKAALARVAREMGAIRKAYKKARIKLQSE